MGISTREELLQAADGSMPVILYGKASLIRIILRFLEREGKKKAVVGVCFADTDRKEGSLGIPICSLKELAEYREQAQVLVALAREKQEKTALQKLEKKGYQKRICIEYNLLSEIGSSEHVHLDFICVGFVKCGTTSLQEALILNPDIYLPKKKETLYMGWRNRFEDAPERFNRIYYSDVKEGQTVGNIEPSYHANAEGIYECFGSGTKVIFMVRNPMDATYSYFKMLMRKTEELQQVKYYKQYHKFDVRMFDNYISDYILSGKETRFQYMKWINRYLRFYDRSQIKVVFFEDVIREPEKTLNEIQEFIGVKAKSFSSLPHSNEGKEVSRNYLSARINRWLYRKDRELRYISSPKKKTRQNQRKKLLHKYTLLENRDKMLPESRKVLLDHYMDSIHELEEFCGRDLKGMWYE